MSKKSLYQTLEDGLLDVQHGDDEITVTLPEWISSFNILIDDAEKCVDHARNQNIAHALIVKGLQHELIMLRAIARPSKKTDAIDKITAQKNVDSYRCTVPRRPKAPGVPLTPEQIADKLIASGKAEELYKLLQEKMRFSESIQKTTKTIIRNGKKN